MRYSLPCWGRVLTGTAAMELRRHSRHLFLGRCARRLALPCPKTPSWSYFVEMEQQREKGLSDSTRAFPSLWADVHPEGFIV